MAVPFFILAVPERKKEKLYGRMWKSVLLYFYGFPEPGKAKSPNLLDFNNIRK
jgi:hypothetical protein